MTGRRSLIAFFSSALLAVGLACGTGFDERLVEVRERQVRGDFAETIPTLQALLRERPESTELNRLYGRALLATESPSIAVWALRSVVEGPSHSADDLFLLARALEDTGQPRSAVEMAERALAVQPSHWGADLVRARAGLRERDFASALESIERLLENESGRPEWHLWRAQALAGQERFAEAEAALAVGSSGSLQEGGPLHLRFCEARVEIAEMRGEETEAGEAWEACARQAPGSLSVLAAAVDFFDERGDAERATALLRRAFEETGGLEQRIRLAERLDHAEAEPLLREATEADSASPEAWHALAELHRRNDDHAAAARAREALMRLEPFAEKFTVALYAEDLIASEQFEKAEQVIQALGEPRYEALLRGRLQLAQGDPAAALEHFDAGVRAWPDNGMAHWLAARAAEKLGDFERAIESYRAALRGGDPDAAYELAELYAQQGDLEPAFFALRVRLVGEPEDTRAEVESVRRLAQMGAQRRARGVLNALRERPGEAAHAALAAAWIALYEGGSGAAALAIEREGLDLTHPENAAVLRAWVAYASEARRHAAVLERAEAAVAAHPEHVEFQAIRALALRAAGLRQPERAAWERVLQLAPESPAGLTGLARLEAEAGNRSAALEHYDRAFAADPSDPGPAWAAVELLNGSGPEREIDLRLERLLFEHPRYVPAARARAERLLAEDRDLERAHELARRATRFGGGAEVLELRGLIELAQQRNALAERSLQLSLQLRPESASTRYHLARAQLATGERERARDSLRAALAQGEFPEANAARAALEQLEEVQKDG